MWQGHRLQITFEILLSYCVIQNSTIFNTINLQKSEFMIVKSLSLLQVIQRVIDCYSIHLICVLDGNLTIDILNIFSIIYRMSYTPQSNTRRILLKPVGSSANITRRQGKQRGGQCQTERSKYQYHGEIQLSSQKDSRVKRGVKCQKQQPIRFSLIQDPRQSQFTYRKYMMLQKILLLLTIFYMFLCMVRTQISVSDPEIALAQDTRMIIIMNIVSLAIVISLFLRAVCCNQLRIDQKKYYCVRHKTGFIADVGRFLSQKNAIFYLFLEYAVMLPQPHVFSQGKYIQLFQSYDEITIKHDVNNAGCLLSMFRVYIFIRSLINITTFATPRAVRLCNYNRVDHTMLYSIKCLLQQFPVRTIMTVFLTQEIVLGYSMRISEGQVSHDNPNLPETGFQNYINCFWCIFITMTTVGYGDYFPKTFPGRMVAFIAAMSGICMSSLLIVSLCAYLTMQANQLKSHLTLMRLQHQKKLQQEATEALVQTMKLSQYLASQQKSNDIQKTKDIFIILKHKIDTVKFRTRKIKSMINNNNIMEEMSRLFELLRESLVQSFNNQVTLKADLQNLDRSNRKVDRKKMQTILMPENMNQIIHESS